MIFAPVLNFEPVCKSPVCITSARILQPTSYQNTWYKQFSISIIIIGQEVVTPNWLTAVVDFRRIILNQFCTLAGGKIVNNPPYLLEILAR